MFVHPVVEAVDEVAAAFHLVLEGFDAKDQPALNQAARSGELSAEQMAVISEAAAANPREEQRLVDLARSGASVEELRRECAPRSGQRKRKRRFPRGGSASRCPPRSSCASTGRRWCGAVRAAILTNGVDVLNVAHIGRKPTAYQQTALEWLSTGCDVLGCDNTVGLETDHVEDWAETKTTLLRLLKRLCVYHHDMKTHHGWALVEGPGKQPMVPPEDPRHPKNKPKRSSAA